MMKIVSKRIAAINQIMNFRIKSQTESELLLEYKDICFCCTPVYDQIVLVGRNRTG